MSLVSYHQDGKFAGNTPLDANVGQVWALVAQTDPSDGVGMDWDHKRQRLLELTRVRGRRRRSGSPRADTKRKSRNAMPAHCRVIGDLAGKLAGGLGGNTPSHCSQQECSAY